MESGRNEASFIIRIFTIIQKNIGETKILAKTLLIQFQKCQAVKSALSSTPKPFVCSWNKKRSPVNSEIVQ